MSGPNSTRSSLNSTESPRRPHTQSSGVRVSLSKNRKFSATGAEYRDNSKPNIIRNTVIRPLTASNTPKFNTRFSQSNRLSPLSPAHRQLDLLTQVTAHYETLLHSPSSKQRSPLHNALLTHSAGFHSLVEDVKQNIAKNTGETDSDDLDPYNKSKLTNTDQVVANMWKMFSFLLDETTTKSHNTPTNGRPKSGMKIIDLERANSMELRMINNRRQARFKELNTKMEQHMQDINKFERTIQTVQDERANIETQKNDIEQVLQAEIVKEGDLIQSIENMKQQRIRLFMKEKLFGQHQAMMNEDIRATKLQLIKLQVVHSNVREKYIQSELETGKLQTEFKESHAAVAEQNRVLQNLEQTIRDLEAKTSHLQQETQHNIIQSDSMNSDIQKLFTMLVASFKTKSDTVIRLNHLQHHKQEIDTIINELEEQYSIRQKKLESIQFNKEELLFKEAKITKNLEQQQNDTVNKKHEIVKLNHELLALATTKQNIELEVQNHQTEYYQLQTKRKVLEFEIAELKQKQEKNDNKINEIKNNNNKDMELITKTNQKFQDLTNEKTVLVAKSDENKVKVRELEEKIDIYHRNRDLKLNTFESELRRISNEITSIEEQIVKDSKQIEDNHRSYYQYQSQIDGARLETQLNDKLKHTLSIQLAEVKVKYNDITNSNNKIHEEIVSNEIEYNKCAETIQAKENEFKVILDQVETEKQEIIQNIGKVNDSIITNRDEISQILLERRELQAKHNLIWMNLAEEANKLDNEQDQLTSLHNKEMNENNRILVQIKQELTETEEKKVKQIEVNQNLQNEITRFKQLIEKGKQNTIALENELKDKEQRNTQANNDIEVLETQLVTTTEQVEADQKENEIYYTKLRQIQEQNKQFENILTQYEKNKESRKPHNLVSVGVQTQIEDFRKEQESQTPLSLSYPSLRQDY